MKNEKRQGQSVLKGADKKKKPHSDERADSASERQTATKTASSSTSTSDEDGTIVSGDEKFEKNLSCQVKTPFQIEKSFTMARPTPASQQSTQHIDSAGTNPNADNQPKSSQLLDLPRLQEVDIQRTLIPMAHASVTLPAVSTSGGNDPTVPSSNLRSYVALPRPGMNGNNRNVKSIDVTNPVSRIELSVLSGTNDFLLFYSQSKYSTGSLEASQLTNPRTPFNSTVGVSRRTSPPLPPIKRSLTTSKTPPIDESKKQSRRKFSIDIF